MNCIAGLVLLAVPPSWSAQELNATRSIESPRTVLELRDGLRQLIEELSAAPTSAVRNLDPLGVHLLIGRCALSGDPRVMAGLQTLAERCPDNTGFSLPALDALWRLGESRAYFLRLVECYATDMRLASEAATILARDPRTDELLRFEVIQRAADAADIDTNNIHNARLAAESVQRVRKQFAELKGTWEQLDFLFTAHGCQDWCRFSHCMTRGLTEEEQLALRFVPSSPRIAWSQAEIERLSSAQPDVAARALCSAHFGGGLAGHDTPDRAEFCLRRSRDRVALAMDPVARQSYRTMSPSLDDNERAIRGW
jgi:hypothetical protein